MQQQDPEGQHEATQDYSQDLADFLLENAQDGAGYLVKVFRSARDPRTHKEKTTWLTDYTDQIPTNQEIRADLGPGQYRLNVVYTRKGGQRSKTSRMIDIAPDPFAATWPAPPNTPAPAPAPTIGADPLLLQIVTMMGNMVTAAINALAQGGSSRGRVSDELGGIADTFTKTLQGMAQMQMQILGDVQRRALGVPDEAQEERRPEGILDLLMWAWQAFGEKILRSPLIAKMAAPQVRTMPQVQYLLKNPNDYQRECSEFCDQAGVTKEQLGQFLGALELPTPEAIAAMQTAAGQEQPAS